MPSARNIFPQMLDLEEENRIDRPKVVTADSPPVPTTARDSTLQGRQRPAALQATDRSTTLHTVSAATPQSFNDPSNPFSKPQRNQILIPGGGVCMGEVDDSDKSSICHSPGWDDTVIKKRKKQKQEAMDKRRRDNETADAQLKRKPRRLTKTPPTIMGMPKPADYTMSVLATPMSEGPGAKDKSRNKGRSSVSLGLRRFSPWKSVHTPGTEDIQQWNDSEGFLGGLKLQQEAVGTTVHANIPTQKIIPPKRRTSKFSEEIGASVLDAAIPYGDVQYGGQDSVDQPIGPLFDQKSFSAGESRSPGKPQSASEASISVMDRSPVRRRKGGTSNPEYLRPTQRVDEEPQPKQHGTSGTSKLPGPVSSRPQMMNNSGKSSTPKCSDGPPLSYREPPELADPEHFHGRLSGYVGSQRKLSMERSFSGFEDEDRVSSAISCASTERRSRGRSFSFHRSSRASTSRPTTGDTTKSVASKDQDAKYAFLVDSNSPARPPNRDTTFDPKEVLVVSQKSSGTSQAASLRGFRTAAKAAFSRQPHAPKLPSNQSTSAKSFVSKEAKPQLSHRPSTVKWKPGPNSCNKTERILGEIVPPTNTQDTRGQRRTIESSGVRRSAESSHRTPIQAPDILKSSNGPEPNSNTSSFSSEEYYSAIDEPTATPFTSLRNSARTDFNILPDRKSNAIAIVSSLMSGALHDEETESEPSKSITMPIRSKISSEEKPPPIRSSVASLPQRTPSLSRSVSNPELQDLSFLPTLKHQPLSRPAKGQERYIPPTQESDEPFQKSPMIFIQPSRQPPTPPRSEDSSPNSPTGLASAQYLSHARLALPPNVASSNRSLAPNPQPRPPSSSSTLLLSPSHSSSSIFNQENTVAKIFTICCRCRYFHDLPSKVYECMAKDDQLVEDEGLGVRGTVSTSVRCSWCGHGMSRMCCEGWMGVVALKERLH